VSVQVDVRPDVLVRVRAGLDEGRRLRMTYYVPGRDENTDRDVDPMRLLLVDGWSYLEGWCRKAEAVRLFRLDRIVELEVLDVAASIPADAEPVDVDRGLFRPSPDDVRVVLELTPSGRWVADHYPCESVTDLGEGRLRVELRTRDTRWVRRLALRLAGDGVIVAPGGLAAEVCDDAERALGLYA
jgi:proteasome accessory factor C